VGNPTNPGNIVISATSVNVSAYPPYAFDIARACVISTTGNMTVNGFTFQSYYENAAATSGGVLTLFNCNFTAPTSGAVSPIVSYGGSLEIFGVCQYSGANPTGSIFFSALGGYFALGYADNISVQNLVFNIAGTPVLTDATAVAIASGSMGIANPAVAFTGGIPNCAQYACSAGGGINFQTGVTTIFPGTQPGIVTSPGWIA
jgi:hypothetical protein